MEIQIKKATMCYEVWMLFDRGKVVSSADSMNGQVHGGSSNGNFTIHLLNVKL